MPLSLKNLLKNTNSFEISKIQLVSVLFLQVVIKDFIRVTYLSDFCKLTLTDVKDFHPKDQYEIIQ